MSWSARSPVHRSTREPGPHGLRRLWHTACFALGCTTSACFYVKPIPEVDVNLPPEIISPEEDPRQVVVRGDSVVLTIIATDPEGDVLSFEWPDLANTTYTIDVTEDREITVCRVELMEPDLLDSPRVRAFVTDGDGDNVLRVTFELVDP